MSSCCVSVCLLVLLGAVMTFGNPVHPPAVSKKISELLNLADQEIGSKPLFTSVLNSINTSCQRKEDIVLLNATLNVYRQIFSSILKHSHDHHHGKTLLDQAGDHRGSVESELKKLQERMEALRVQLGSVSDSFNGEDIISNLNNINVNDTINQRRALAEYDAVSRVASLIST
ncbi:hypothetical protein INR49_019749 [Caranx melampygus]|nr:hypothetical protein INR49_019749 [Caranx melampygus]